MIEPVQTASGAAPAAGSCIPGLEAAAQALETEFLAEMLKAAGLGTPPEGFGGGAGEEQFASLLVREQAGAMASRGGVGLAEAIVRSFGAGDCGRER